MEILLSIAIALFITLILVIILKCPTNKVEPKEEIKPGTIVELKNGNFLVKAKNGYIDENGCIFTIEEFIAIHCQFPTREKAEKVRDKYIIFINN